MYSFLLALIYISFISLGLPDSLLGSGWPAMHIDLGVNESMMGVITMIISGGTVVSSLVSNRLIKKFGTAIVTVVSVFMTAAAILGFGIADKFYLLIIFAIPYGLGAGAIDSALNNYVALHYSARHMSWLHCFWGVGAIVSPFVMGFALTHFNWHTGYLFIGGVQFVIGLLLLFTLKVWKINKEPEVFESEVSKQQSAIKIKGVLFILVGFFAYCAAEATCMQWASTYFVNVKNYPVETAANLASLFYIGMTVGRFISGFVTNKLGDRKMILGGTLVLFCGIGLLILPVDNRIFSLAAFLIIGLGCAPIYPSVVHSAPGCFGAENSSRIIGMLMASAYIGTTFMPPLFGLIGGLLGYNVMPIFLTIFFLLMIIMTELTFKTTTKPKTL